MLGKLLKTIGGVISKTRDGVSDSTDFLDEFLEKEYIYHGVQDVKEATGKIVEESGKIFQKSVDAVKEATEDLNLENLKGSSEKVTIKAKKAKEKLLEAGEHIKDRVTDKEAIYDSWEEAVEINREIGEKAENLLDEIKQNLKGNKESE